MPSPFSPWFRRFPLLLTCPPFSLFVSQYFNMDICGYNHPHPMPVYFLDNSQTMLSDLGLTINHGSTAIMHRPFFCGHQFQSSRHLTHGTAELGDRFVFFLYNIHYYDCFVVLLNRNALRQTVCTCAIYAYQVFGRIFPHDFAHLLYIRLITVSFALFIIGLIKAYADT